MTLFEPLALASAPAAASEALEDEEKEEEEELESPAALMRVTSRESYLRAAFWVCVCLFRVWVGKEEKKRVL